MKKISGGALFKDDKLLAVKRTPNRPVWPGMWEIPGGKAEDNETYEKCLEREFFEETGTKISVLKEYFEFSYDYNGIPAIEKDFIVKGDNYNIKIDPKEHTEYKWVSEEDLNNLQASPLMKKSMKMAFAAMGQ